MTIENLNSSGTILAGRYGINISDAVNSFQIGQINISGLIAGGTAGMYIGNNQHLTKDINVKGTLTGGEAGIINKGTLGNQDGSGGIKLNGGTISAFGSSYFRAGVGPAILNTGNGIIYGDTELNNKAQLIGGVFNDGNGRLEGNIIVKSGSSISGGIVNAGNGVVTGSIKIEGEGSKVDSITNTGNGTISGGVSVGAGSSVENVTNSGNGTISGSITNDGNLGSINNSGNISGNIENNNGDVQINNDGKLDGAIQVGSGAGNTAISNGSNGNIGGGITNNSSSNISINNQGTVKPDSNGNHITNNGGGSVTVEDWVISTDSSGKVESVNVGGSNASNTTVDKVTVETNGNLDLGQSINPEDLIQNTTNGGSISSGSVQVGTGENANPAIALYKDPRTGKYVFAVNAGASIASMMLQTVVDQTSRRSLMIDTLMDQSAYKFHHWNKKSSKNGIEPKENIDGFFLPYRSYNKINLSDNAGVSSGHTTGYIAGFNALKDDGIYGVYLGTENNNFNNANVFDLDTKAYYGGVKFSNILKTGPYYDVVLGTHLKAAVLKNDLTRFIEKPNNASLTSKGKTDSYAYGINTNLAINYYLSDKTAITPAVGLGYEGGHTKAFSMVGDAAFDHERYYSNTLNLIQTKASLKWFQIWNDKISTVVEGGARFNLNDTLDSTVNFNGGKYTGSIDLPRVYGYSNFSFIYSLTKNLDLSLNYNGIASDNSGQTHTGYLEFNFKY
ncbi:autotransporter domain-containing protein [Campylobacter volucris]|uniref:autotransporter outer membrane beta-barrel domain-containing protein n=1 Tax=Campylobacter volucris TaxID=1031542 RepID=UPI00189F8D49|nr:autotransporter outer membrane beta-barrel domain-containing protein [Campylobacter volucris]MBF7045507.1 autotransporter domain-containing protein [Campylobacter volucris]